MRDLSSGNRIQAQCQDLYFSSLTSTKPANIAKLSNARPSQFRRMLPSMHSTEQG